MNAVSFAAPKKVEIVDIPQPVAGPEDVLVDIHYAGLCGTDLNTYRGLMPLVTYPRIPGHELGGTIVATGAQVPDSIKVGDRVALSPYSNCGICPACRVGRPNCCQFNQTLGVQRDGALARSFAIHYSKAFVNNQLSFEALALVEPLSVGYHAANRGRVTEIDTVLVIGCGAIGIGVIAAAVRKGATVIAADIDAAKLAEAEKFGARYTIDTARQEAMSAVNGLTNQEGVSVAIEAVGLPATYRLAVEATCFAGRVVYIGYAKREVCYDSTDFVRKELDIMGARNALRVFPAVINMVEKQQALFTSLVSRTYPFAETAAAFKDWDAKPEQITKILIDLRA